NLKAGIHKTIAMKQKNYFFIILGLIGIAFIYYGCQKNEHSLEKITLSNSAENHVFNRYSLKSKGNAGQAEVLKLKEVINEDGMFSSKLGGKLNFSRVKVLSHEKEDLSIYLIPIKAS